MYAAVYRGSRHIEVESVPTPRLQPGELLLAVESCGICHTDLKKVEHDLLPPPRIYGHETAGVVAAIGEGVKGWQVGDRAIAFHHVPCRHCFYCQRRLYAQCPQYKKVGITAGFEPAGGGFSQFVRVMDWIVADGMERIPAQVSFDQASWVEPVNTCLKGVRALSLVSGDTVAVLGQGPIGLIFTALALREGAQVFTSDGLPFRRVMSERFGAHQSFAPQDSLFDEAIRAATGGRGADAVILATNAPGLVDQALTLSRPGAKVLLFAQTSRSDRIELRGSDICVGERTLMGSYSADIDLQRESAELVFNADLPFEQLISHAVPLHDIQQGIEIAQHPGPESLKVVVHPQESK